MNTTETFLTNAIRTGSDDRRNFLQKLALASTGIAAIMGTGSAFGQSTITDVDILQFALNLEYLEAEFYTVARTGKTIDQQGVGITGSGNAGATTGGKQVTFIEGSTLARSADEIGADERAHVTLLRGALTAAGVSPISKPAINLNALGIGFGSQEEFIALGRSFEDVGVSAYGAAAPLIQSKAYLAVAARILAAEAEHTGSLRLHAALYNVKTTPVDAADILPYPSGTRFSSLDAMGLSVVRTPGQVLNIVYGGQAQKTSGGFFPAGTNGNINMSDAAATKPAG